MAYTKNFPAEISASFEDVHFCLDAEVIDLHGVIGGNFQKLNVDLYDCIPSESPVKCAQTISINHIVMNLMVLEQTLNVKIPENPYGYRKR
jgi:hypothetical protein